MLTTRYHLDEAHLSYYDEKLKSWASSQPVKTLPSSLYPWTQTDKAGAVTCWPVGGTQLKPTVDFLFTETPPASGDKSPSNPSTITGVSEVTVKHRTSNLLYPIAASSGTTRDVSWSSNGDGSFTFNGTVSSNSDAVAAFWSFSDIPNGAYRLKMKGSELGTHPRLVLTIEENGSFSYPAFTENSSSYVAVTVTDTRKLRGIYFRFIEGYTFNNITVSPYLVLGDEGYDIPLSDSYTISLGGTFYGGTLDVASGVMTVTWAGHVFDGTERPSFSTLRTGGIFEVQYNNLGLPNGIRYSGNQICSHLNYNGAYNTTYEHFYMADKLFIWRDIQTEQEFLDWLVNQKSAGTPVTFVYPLATPTTVQLTPSQILSLAQTDKYTPRLNTVYTDASAVQVGYVKSPIREEQELTQAIVAQGGEI